MQSAVKAILFDKDGTLLDFDATWASVNEAAALFAAQSDQAFAEDLLRIAGMDPVSRKTAGGSLFAAGNSEEIVEAWVAAGAKFQRDALRRGLDRLFTRSMDAAAVLPGIPEALESLRTSGFRLGVASSDSEGAIRTFLEASGLVGQIEFIAGYDSGHGPKPEPGMVHAFARHLDLAPSAIAMVGDNTHDLEMARAADAGLAVGVLSGTGTRAELELLSDHLLQSVADLPKLLT
ncbi:HAD family hydrolase [Roseibium litorale]|uniref:phosphoglycolate phosphatase n=1 Tax=Roseibium litorale TaxID=2803841 RepID=A0ABR9CHR2_9HYPH|nr:HAD family hydrolase [Roseibium litorale]MBD8890372.1 HAD family hydrolase [Roseibium litorale]